MIKTARSERRRTARENDNRSSALLPVPLAQWPVERHGINSLPDAVRTRMWWSNKFLVQEFVAPAPALFRLSINRTAMRGNTWLDQISWEELQQIKNEVGYFAHTAVEVYPPLLDEVNDANIRHLWILGEQLPFVWVRS